MSVDSGYRGRTILPRSVGGQRKPLGNNPLEKVCGKQDSHRHHSSEECLWAKGTIEDIIALRNMFMGKASHCRDHSSGECLWKTGTIIDITPLRSVYGQKEPL